MNWLIYIGGGVVILYLWALFLEKCDPDGNTLFKTEKGTLDLLVMLLIVISPIAIWIWICWRFIR